MSEIETSKPSTLKGAPHVLTVRELSEYLRVHPTTVYRLLRTKQLPGFRVGADWRFNLDAIREWCAREGAGVSTSARGRRKRSNGQ